MTPKRILLIGSGERVRKAALPVFEEAPGFEIDGIVSRTPKSIESGGRQYEVLGLESITQDRLSGIDLIYMVVKKPAVPVVLRQLAALDCSKIDLLIETPVMLVRHLGHRKLLEHFRHAWVSEDCQTLPCLDAVSALFESEAMGELVSAHFDRSAYAYHGMAMIKTVLGGGPIRTARQIKRSDGSRERTITLANGRKATVIDPRDYSQGSMTFCGASRTVSDGPDRTETDMVLEAVVQKGQCVGFHAGGVLRELDERERRLIGERGAGAGVTAWMDGMKRVGFLNLMDRIHQGVGAYSLDDAIEDSVVDYYLEKFGRYRSTPLTQPNASLPRMAFSILTKLTDR
jgi:hypothetical protein